MAQRGFTQVPNDDEILSFPDQPAVQPKQGFINRAAVDMLQIALAQLSKRFIVALSSLFTLLTVGSVFYLWLLTPDPSNQQIVSLTIYAGFVVLINFLNMRRM